MSTSDHKVSLPGVGLVAKVSFHLVFCCLAWVPMMYETQAQSAGSQNGTRALAELVSSFPAFHAGDGQKV